jgi:hypothetical protein
MPLSSIRSAQRANPSTCRVPSFPNSVFPLVPELCFPPRSQTLFPLVPKLCLGTPFPKLCFQRPGRLAAAQSSDARSPQSTASAFSPAQAFTPVEQEPRCILPFPSSPLQGATLTVHPAFPLRHRSRLRAQQDFLALPMWAEGPAVHPAQGIAVVSEATLVYPFGPTGQSLDLPLTPTESWRGSSTSGKRYSLALAVMFWSRRSSGSCQPRRRSPLT